MLDYKFFRVFGGLWFVVVTGGRLITEPSENGCAGIFGVVSVLCEKLTNRDAVGLNFTDRFIAGDCGLCGFFVCHDLRS